MDGTNPTPGRRTLLAGVAGAATALLAGCAGSGTGTATEAPTAPATTRATATTRTTSAAATEEASTTTEADSGGLQRENAVEARFSIEFTGDGTATVTHDGGDELAGSRLSLVNDDAGATTTWREGPVTAGDTAAIGGSEGDRIRVLYRTEAGERVVLASTGSPPTDGK